MVKISKVGWVKQAILEQNVSTSRKQ